ncbi:unnamed protein product [Adineta ricciae]|uniref:Uncharacterized protein n=1 Tax=Adineta ricciae TaxID=249248 RepID=A0A814SAJ0_ADIRI|nr:unnamed protein product [Adineta ricciae]CAF1145420.1 unnamed protein product [Adineta ricciae]
MLDQIQSNALNMLTQQLSQLIGGLFGKRGVSDVLNINLQQVLAPFIAQIKQIYQQVFSSFLQIVQNIDAWISKPDWARIEFTRVGADAEALVSHLNIGVEFLQPLVNLVQQHLGALIDNFQGIISQALNAIKPNQLIGSGSLLQP